MKYTFSREDNSNSRVYFNREYNLYCWQDEGFGDTSNFKFYRCSSDGEPSYEVVNAMVPLTFEPTSKVGRDLVLWAQKLTKNSPERHETA